jgi:hypothetical protein
MISIKLTGKKGGQTLIYIKQNKRAYKRAQNNRIIDFNLYRLE